MTQLPDLDDLLHGGWRWHQQGEYVQAEALYRQVLTASPRHPMACYLLGKLAGDLGRHQHAVECFLHAIRSDPGQAMFHTDLGQAYHALGQLNEAQQSYRQALRLVPRQAATLVNLGNVLLQSENATQAVECYRQAIECDPRLADAHCCLGVALEQLDLRNDAIGCYRQAVLLRHEYPRAHYNLGTALHKLGQFKEALSCLQLAVSQKPDFALAHNNLGTVLEQLRRLPEARESFARAVELQPLDPEFHLNLGAILERQGDFEEAAACHREALRLKPDYVEALNALGTALQHSGNLDQAKDCYLQALQIKPNDPVACFDLATALQAEGNYAAASDYFRMVLKTGWKHAQSLTSLAAMQIIVGNWTQATEYIERALRHSPDDGEAHFYRGTILLTHGNFTEGWQEYDHRLQSRQAANRGFSQPRWDGSPLVGRTLLAYAEYGLGDAIHFIRYIRLVKERDPQARVLSEVHTGLIPLLTGSGVTGLVAKGEPLPHFDLQMPMMSLPAIFRTDLDNMPAEIPYLFANSVLVETWQKRLAQFEGFKIGIHWQGNPGYSLDRHRSMRLECFAPLARVPGVRLFSLQKGSGTEQIPQVANQFPVIALDGLDEQGGAFMDTAAVMKSLNLIITSDSAVAHLAGALGIDVWLALAAVPDWRWMLDREDSPWYPTMRLFRQSRLDDWSEPFQRMATQLDGLIAARSLSP